jgi:hypothetical protein
MLTTTIGATCGIIASCSQSASSYPGRRVRGPGRATLSPAQGIETIRLSHFGRPLMGHVLPTAHLLARRLARVVLRASASFRDNALALHLIERPDRLAPRRPGDPAILMADATGARDLLGWSAMSDLATMIGDAGAGTCAGSESARVAGVRAFSR